MRFDTSCVVILPLLMCACVVEDTATDEQAGMNMQGMNMQGMNMQGSALQGMMLQGFRAAGVLAGVALEQVRVERGELVAVQDRVTLRGAALVGARLRAQVRSVAGTATAVVEYRITGVVTEYPQYDPTLTGSTFLYSLEQWVEDSATWQPACGADADGRRVAIPLAGTWDEHGNRIATSSQFTFGCTTGVIAKCYRWGYRPWVTGYGDLVAMHWTCTRLARADYCGNGIPHTFDGTLINVWDTLPAPGPLQQHGPKVPPGMAFEAGWTTRGAVCLNHLRWAMPSPSSASLCPDRVLLPNPTACNSAASALALDPSTRMFTESYAGMVPSS